MPCPAVPPGYFPTPPALPGGVSLSSFSPPSISLGYCCNLQVPPWGSFPLPLPPFPAVLGSVIAGLMTSIVPGIQATLDAVPIPCPLE